MRTERVTILPAPLVLLERVGLEAFCVDDHCNGCQEFVSECICDDERQTLPVSERETLRP